MIATDDAAAPATARARGYALCGELLLRGVVTALRPWLAAISELAATDSQLSDEEEAAEHHRVMTLEVFAYEGVFLGDGPVMVGGAISEEVARSYAAAGWTPAAGEAAADHVGHELHFMAALSRAGDDESARAFLDDHLLRWLPALVWTLEGQQSPRYAAIGRLALDLALHHRAELGGATTAAAPTLPALDGLLHQARTGLKRLSRALLRPASAGWFLSAGDVARVARRVDLPHGFGGRTKMLESLFESARDYQRMPALMNAISGEAERHAAAWRRLAGAQGQLIEPIAAAWLERLDATRAMLDTVASAASAVAETA